MYALILFSLIGLYALSSYLLWRFKKLTIEAREMSDAELADNFDTLNKAFEIKPAYWKAQELRAILNERQKRGLFKKMSSEQLTSHFKRLSEICAALPARSIFGYKQELAYVQKEMKKRKLL